MSLNKESDKKKLLSLWTEQLQKQLGLGEGKTVEDTLEFIIWYNRSHKDLLVKKIGMELYGGTLTGNLVMRVNQVNCSSRWPFSLKLKCPLGPQGGEQRNTTRTVLWDPLQLDNLQEKFVQRPGKSRTGYLWCLWLGEIIWNPRWSRGGFWGPGVFLTGEPDSNNHIPSHSEHLTVQRSRVLGMRQTTAIPLLIKQLLTLTQLPQTPRCWRWNPCSFRTLSHYEKRPTKGQQWS